METLRFQTGIFPPPLHAARRQEIRRVTAYIERNFARAIALDELAAIAGLSLFRFIKLFRREIGLPPHRYHSYIRVQVAQKLMLEGLPVAEIASEVGFCDQSHLNRHFKAFCGVTPGAYIKRRRAEPAERFVSHASWTAAEARAA